MDWTTIASSEDQQSASDGDTNLFSDVVVDRVWFVVGTQVLVSERRSSSIEVCCSNSFGLFTAMAKARMVDS